MAKYQFERITTELVEVEAEGVLEALKKARFEFGNREEISVSWRQLGRFDGWRSEVADDVPDTAVVVE